MSLNIVASDKHGSFPLAITTFFSGPLMEPGNIWATGRHPRLYEMELNFLSSVFPGKGNAKQEKEREPFSRHSNVTARGRERRA